METWDWEIVGLVLIGIGFTTFTIGGFISAVEDPKTFNEELGDLFRKPRLGMWGPKLTRRSKWPIIIGFAVGVTGMAVLYAAGKAH
jgi:hypothetical protein